MLHAIDQLSQTIDYFKTQFEGKVFVRIILRKVAKPKVIEADARVVKLRKVLRRYGGDLDYSSTVYEKDAVY